MTTTDVSTSAHPSADGKAARRRAGTVVLMLVGLGTIVAVSLAALGAFGESLPRGNDYGWERFHRWLDRELAAHSRAEHVQDLRQAWHVARSNEVRFSDFMATLPKTQLDRAGVALREAWELGPRADTANVIALLELFGRQDFDEARMWLDRALAADSRSYQALVDRGTLHTMAGDPTAAAADFAAAIMLEPRRPEAYFLRSNVHRFLMPAVQWPALAESDLDDAVRLEPRLADAWRARGELLASHGSFEAALEDVERAAAILPDDPHVRLIRGRLYAQLGHDERAEADFDAALRAARPTADGHMLRASVWRERGEVTQALQAYQAALEADPRAVGAHLAAGRIHEHMENLSAAARHYMRAIELEPEGPDAWNAWLGMARLHVAQDNAVQADIAFEEALKLAPLALRSAVVAQRNAALAGTE